MKCIDQLQGVYESRANVCFPLRTLQVKLSLNSPPVSDGQTIGRVIASSNSTGSDVIDFAPENLFQQRPWAW
jgi:hypothetical protein